MKKVNYVAPKMERVEIEIEASVLAGSYHPGSVVDPGGHGSAGGGFGY